MVIQMAKRGPKPASVEEPVVEMMVLSIKMTPEFHGWLGEVAETERDTVVKFVEKAIVEHAKRLKFPKPAPKRTIR
jgi:hypothetical protein